MIRGDIVMADLGDPVGHEQAFIRPVVVVSADPWLDSNPPVITVVPMTRTRSGRATHVELEPGLSGLKATSYVKCEDIRAISPARIRRHFGRIDSVALLRIDTILRRILQP
ncbi:MAG: type II toxin-antitoxin system PemK/MazF family toxin [Microbacteriaceae bacterium]|nr:MAG: type II toxin-antitoxin system PemK/MazF family toxin [Microbacteriaceae bacterium]